MTNCPWCDNDGTVCDKCGVVSQLPPGAAMSDDLAAEFEKAGLLRSEYPDQMAAASCSCEPEAVCGAHRLLARYEALYAHLVEVNADRRRLREAGQR